MRRAMAVGFVILLTGGLTTSPAVAVTIVFLPAP